MIKCNLSDFNSSNIKVFVQKLRLKIHFQEVIQSVGTTFNKAKVTNSNPSPPLVWTCKKKEKKTK
jgi:hypothetical protein